MDERDLKEASRSTIDYYDGQAVPFWEGTRDHDVSQNIAAILQAIPGSGPHRILDFGCGPGRDLATFKALGHEPVGLEGSPNFCEMARTYSGAVVLNQDFLALDLEPATFDGVFCNATIFHVPSAALPRVLSELYAALKPGGVFFSSNPRGDNIEGWNGPRYSTYHDLPAWTRFMESAGFLPLGHYYRPAGLPRDQQPWLASTWRKPEQ